MVTLHEKLATSLEKLQKLQSDGRHVFRSEAFPRVDRERLLEQGFLREVIKGWLISTSPGAAPGDTTPWFASFWEFCARYCEYRFGSDWHLSPEQSLLLHAEDTVIPTQVIIYSPQGTNNTIKLLFGTSLYDLKSKMPNAADLVMKNGLCLFKPAAALVRASEDFMRRHPAEIHVMLVGIKDASEILGPLLEGGHTVVAGRLAGAFTRVGRKEIAEEIVKAMKAAGHDVRPADPFADQQTFGSLQTGVPPIVGRLQSFWSQHREQVIAAFPKAPGLPKDTAAYLKSVDEIYKHDAYNSLSIEGYRVTPELIERVRGGTWNPDAHAADRQNRDALAARGYWQAFQSVKTSIEKIIGGTDAAALVRCTYRDWYREMFQPCVAAGTHTGASARRLPESFRLPARVAACAPALGSRSGRDGSSFRSSRRRERAGGPYRARSLAVRLHPSVSGRQRPHGAVSHECHACVRGLSVDGDPRRGPRRLYEVA